MKVYVDQNITATNNTMKAYVDTYSKGLASLTSQVTVASSNTETQLIGMTVPANTMSPGTAFRITAAGIINDTSSAPTATWRIRIGSSSLSGNIATSIAPTLAISQTNKPWMLNALVTIRTSGAGGTVKGNGVIWGEYSGTLAQAVKGSPNTPAVAVDTTSDKILELTFQFGTANVANNLTCQNAVIERIKA
jgi:hypothetical protein